MALSIIAVRAQKLGACGSVEGNEAGIQYTLGIESLLKLADHRPLRTVVCLPLLAVERNPTREVAFGPHEHRSGAGKIHPRQRLTEKVRGDGWQEAEAHKQVAWRPHEQGHRRRIAAGRPEQDVSA